MRHFYFAHRPSSDGDTFLLECTAHIKTPQLPQPLKIQRLQGLLYPRDDWGTNDSELTNVKLRAFEEKHRCSDLARSSPLGWLLLFIFSDGLKLQHSLPSSLYSSLHGRIYPRTNQPSLQYFTVTEKINQSQVSQKRLHK